MNRFVILALFVSCKAEPVVEPPSKAKIPYTTERPGGMQDDPVLRPRDVTGRSVKTPRVRAVHSTVGDPREGTTGWLVANDPWLAYARGRELFLREFSVRDGTYGEAGKLDGKTLDDGSTKIMSRDHANSCAMCHNVPWRDGGAGATIQKNAGSGRNTPHVFGAGLMEMIGWQSRLRLLEIADTNRDGWIATDESKGVRAILKEGGSDLDVGIFGDPCGCGRPHLNGILYVWYVDAKGERIPWAKSLKDDGVAGYNFEMQVFGHGQRDRFSHGGITATLRAFSAQAYDIHSGLTACDPTMNEEPNKDGLGRVSLCGAPQFFTGTTRDRGQRRDAAGRSLDDPDRDGVIEEITEGDLDLIELYQLNHPKPAEKLSPGRALFDKIGCARCHVPDWTLDAMRDDADYTKRRAGDRRMFDLDITFVDGQPRGRIVKVKKGAAVAAKGLYSDFLHHDLGEAFHETQFDGTKVTRFRTAPLWGVGSTAPFGHDGASLDLDDVIRRHGGESTDETKRYLALSDADRASLIDFLRGLVLYSTEMIPCDVNGDDTIDEHFVVDGVDTGRERFNPEWLFRVPGRIEGWMRNAKGERIFSQALVNVRESYGIDLEWLKDRDRDGWPDRQQP